MLVYSGLVLWNFLLEECSTKILAVFLAVLVLVRTLQMLKEASSLPPGPWGLPILGSLPFLKGDLHLHFRDLTHKYGSLFSTRLGSQLIVVLSDYKMIRDAFRKEEFTGRPNTEFTDLLDGYGKLYEMTLNRLQLTHLNGLGGHLLVKVICTIRLIYC